MTQKTPYKPRLTCQSCGAGNYDCAPVFPARSPDRSHAKLLKVDYPWSPAVSPSMGLWVVVAEAAVETEDAAAPVRLYAVAEKDGGGTGDGTGRDAPILIRESTPSQVDILRVSVSSTSPLAVPTALRQGTIGQNQKRRSPCLAHDATLPGASFSDRLEVDVTGPSGLIGQRRPFPFGWLCSQGQERGR